MARLFALLALLAFALIGTARAGDSPLKIERPWIIAVPPAASATAAFMVLKNPSDQPVKIVAIFSPIAATAEPMIGTRNVVDGKIISGMESVAVLEIPAKGRRTLEPGGDHLMLMDLKTHPKVGEQVLLTLRIEPGGEVRTLKVPVAFSAPTP